MGTEEISDDEIIERCLGGDRDQYAVLVGRYQDMAYTVAYRMLGDEGRARDAAQEAFLSAYCGLKRFRRRSKFSTWLISIVINACRDQLRKRRGTIALTDVQDSLRSGAADPEERLREKERADMLQQALLRLPPEYREVIVLKHIQGLGYHEIAAMCGEREGTLKVRAHRARELLRWALREGGWNHG